MLGTTPLEVRDQLPLLDEVLDFHAAQLGRDFTAYRNHAYRIANLCLAMVTGSDEDERLTRTISLAAAFHDLGIWTDDTFDYLAPSRRLARDWIAAKGCPVDTAEIESMIEQHHKITPFRGEGGRLVEAFRRADWADVSLGILSSGLARDFLRKLHAAFPAAGFHLRLLQLTGKRTLKHPLSPLPMMRL
ncbi:hypothetical protein ACA097_00630 [Pseudomonas sp. QL9]|uniref:hypothetical protein n=1 Tax=Pseudomonas sp. QL9 TaxID=3242725 RepID=UPI00352B9AD5